MAPVCLAPLGSDLWFLPPVPRLLTFDPPPSGCLLGSWSFSPFFTFRHPYPIG
jgi:hypothetical protein